MAYINVQDWTCQEVIEWIKGLDCMNTFYIKAFANNQINGNQLLSLRPYELEELGIISIGHQEVILEAVEHLRNFHYNLDRENLQYLALQVSTISTSLHTQLNRNLEAQLDTQILSDVSRAISKVKTLIGWLDRSPFQGHTQYNEIRAQLLKMGLEMATIAQRDRFVRHPILQITNLAERLSKLANYIIQDITDPMLLQPSYLDLVTLKKRESELGFYIMPSYHYIHRVTDIKYNSPAHNSGKVEDGDEIVQINYQTVVGWQYKKVLIQLQESPIDVLLTLKKRPKHTKIYGQLGLIKLPSKKRSLPYRWDNLPSPRVELFSIPDLMIPLKYVPEKVNNSESGESSGNESDILSAEVKSSDKDLRLYMPKPRAAILQRRHTICGDDLINFKHIGNMVLWHNRKTDKVDVDSPSLRDKSVSFGFGLELAPRPSTCLGIADNLANAPLKTSLPNMSSNNKKETETIHEQEGEDGEETNIKTGVCKVVRFDSNKVEDYNKDSKYTCNVEDTIIESFTPIPYADDEIIQETPLLEVSKANDSVNIEPNVDSPPKPLPRTIYDTSNQLVEAVNSVVVNRENVKRGRLDKSYSTPTYDSSDTEMPPAIEPRQQAMKIPPVPPRKIIPSTSPPAFVKPQTTGTDFNDENKSKMANVIDLKSKRSPEVPIPLKPNVSAPISVPAKQPMAPALETVIRKPFLEEPTEVSELVTPTKVKTLTNKKKNSLMAKRRKVTLKSLGTSTTIQGHLYQRAKDKTEVAYWAKLYFVLMETALYGFKSKEAQKADCVIYLSGFTVSLAKEVHSKQFAFKVYHPRKTFYLAAETAEALAQWMEYIKQATLRGSTNHDCESKELFSETECSEDELDLLSNIQLCTPSPLSTNHEKSASSDQTPTSTKHYHLGFGSLKKFARGATASHHNNSNASESSSPSDSKFLGFFTSNKSNEKKATDIVPTAQFKSYRKVKENGGLQLGATSMINSNVSDMYLASGGDNSSILSGFSNDTHKKPEEISHQEEPIFIHPSPKDERRLENPSKKLRKTHNYLHASNPNLLDFTLQQTIDFPTSTATCNWDHQQPGMTLLDLMLQQRAEEMKDMYNRRVEQGIEKVDDRTLPKKAEKPIVPPKPADPHIEKIQKRSLPITPDYAQSFKPDDRAILYTRSKEGQKLRDFGYELISGDDANSSNKQTINSDAIKHSDRIWPPKRGDKIGPTSGSMKKRSGLNWMTNQDKEEEPPTSCLGAAGSFRKPKNNIFNFMGESKQGKNSGKQQQLIGLKKSNTSITPDLQCHGPKVLRKNSAPSPTSSVMSGIPYFSKLSFASSTTKEKKLLGSPKLHRAIFGKSQSPNTVVDHEIFSPIIFPKIPRSTSESLKKAEQEAASEASGSYPAQQQSYPELNSSLPPVFKPEIYSMNMLKKTHSKHEKEKQ